MRSSARPTRRTRFGFASALVVAFTSAFASPALATESVTIQLPWHHQFQFAGYYQAIEQGHYRAEGLEVHLLESLDEDADAADEVLSGRGEYGVGTSGIVQRRARGEPIVAVAPIFQHSPRVLFARADGPIRTAHDLRERTLAIEPQAIELFAYLAREGVPNDRFQRVPLANGVDALARGDVDAFSGYSTDEPYGLTRASVRANVFDPRDAGVDFYGDTLFTTDAEVRDHSDRVRAVRAASLRGWEYALSHVDETIELIRRQYSDRHSAEHLRFEAEKMRPLILPDVVELGHQSVERWRHIAEIYAELGIVPRGARLDGFVFDASSRRLPAWVRDALAVTLVGLAVLAAFAVSTFRLNRRLRQANTALADRVREIEDLGEKLAQQAVRDGLTGLFNRRYLDETLPRELARARREREPLTLVTIDLDKFKRINDTHGHAAGDAALRAVAGVVAGRIRQSDAACRAGGEEITLVLPAMPLDHAARYCESLRAAIAELAIDLGGTTLRVTASFGVAVFPEHGETPHELAVAADRALYAAKKGGRNRVEIAPGRPDLTAPASLSEPPRVSSSPVG